MLKRSNRVALLESLFKSPCGSLVLWRHGAASPPDVGVWLLGGAPRPGADVKWLVDGQQRTRALVGLCQEILTFERAKYPLPLLKDGALSEIEGWLTPRNGPAAGPVDDGAEDPVDDLTDGDELPSVRPLVNWYVSVARFLRTVADSTKAVATWLNQIPDTSRYSIFRTLHSNALTAKTGQPRGLLPLGLFLTDPAKSFPPEAVELLHDASWRDHVEWLQREIPWGPLFLTGRGLTWERLIATPPNLDPLRALFQRPFLDALKPVFSMYVEEQFAVGFLPDTEVEDAIEAYVRINRSGVRVQAEERAFAMLTRWYPPLIEELGRFMLSRDRGAALDDPRELLIHHADRTFGFSLWMRTVVRFAVLRILPKTALHWLSADAIERWTTTDWLARSTDKAVETIRDAAERASSSLLVIDRLLSHYLFLDHRMARPDTRSVLPLLEVLSRVNPAELNGLLEGRDTRVELCLARILQWTMLHPYLGQGELERLCTEIHRNPEQDVYQTERLVPMLARYLRRLHEMWGADIRKQRHEEAVPGEAVPWALIVEDLTGWSKEQFSKLVEDSRSLQHAAVGWLYAIEHRGGATEFDWFVQVQGSTASWNGLAKLPPDPAAYPLQAMISVERADDTGTIQFAPERQHIVPFKDARKIANKGGSRTTASPANQVGNLTWLSSRQNATDNGFWERWMVIGDSREDGPNLRARGFEFSLDDVTTATDVYRRLFQQRASGNHLPALSGDFERFCRIRREWMKQQLNEWLEDDSQRAVLDIVATGEPAGQAVSSPVK